MTSTTTISPDDADVAGVGPAQASRFHALESDADDTLSIGRISLSSVASSHSTPLYVIDGAALAARLNEFSRVFEGQGFRLYYSVKANPSLVVLSHCRQGGFGFDACSPGDLHLASISGAPPSDISYTGVGLGEGAIEELVSRGIRLNLDSMSEVRKFVTVAGGAAVGIRIVPDVKAGFHPHMQSGMSGGKFGIGLDDVPEAVRILRDAGARLRTLHTHLGSSISTPGPFLQALDALLAHAREVPEVEAVNLGGGMAARYHPDDSPFPLRDLREGILDELREFEATTGRRLKVELEPGEILVSEAVYLLCRVMVIKTWQKVSKGPKHVAVTDASMNLLPAHSLYGTYFHVYVDGKAREGDRVPYDIYGCTNQTGDRLAMARPLPALEEGDLLVIRNAGAYAYSRSTQFNERPRPAEVWLEDGRAQIVREPESLESLTNGQRFPLR